MQGKLSDILRIGKVASIDEVKCTARVTFEDRQDTISNDLSIIVPFTLKDNFYYMPAIGERVLCVFEPNAIINGYILGSFYAEKRLPPQGKKEKTYVQFEDKTLIEYDKKEHKLSIDIPTSSNISIDIFAKSDISINCDANISVNAKGDTSLKTGGTMLIESGGIMTIKGEIVEIN